jgi:NitT/TauT family transport system ATP-binding protein
MIQVQEATKTFETSEGDVHALAPFSVEIPTGGFYAIVGPSGCGKSTLLSLVAGLVEPSSGVVRVSGEEVDGPVPDMGVAFQQDLLLDWRNVLSNVLVQAEFRGLDAHEWEERALALLSSMGLEGFERRYPWELSGGMRQRVALARALVHDPKLLLLDEPFGAVDGLTREKLNLDLEKLWERIGTTCLLVTHDVEEAVFLADAVLVMTPRPGRVAGVVHVDVQRPRSLDLKSSPEFVECVRKVRELLVESGAL